MLKDILKKIKSENKENKLSVSFTAEPKVKAALLKLKEDMKNDMGIKKISPVINEVLKRFLEEEGYLDKPKIINEQQNEVTTDTGPGDKPLRLKPQLTPPND